MIHTLRSSFLFLTNYNSCVFFPLEKNVFLKKYIPKTAVINLVSASVQFRQTLRTGRSQVWGEVFCPTVEGRGWDVGEHGALDAAAAQPIPRPT